MSNNWTASTDVLTTSGDNTSAGASGCVLYVAAGDDADRGRSLTLREGTARVGSAGTCDLSLHDKSVSRFHVEFSVTAAGVSFRDLGSTNGTFYFGNRIEKGLLRLGTQLVLGKTTLAVLPLSDGRGLEVEESTSYGKLRGVSFPMRRLFAIMRKLEASDAPVLVEGETGTGKELVAATLHERGLRKDKPFVVFDCGAVPKDLVDSELFGHVRGAFTGATSDRPGVFELAHTGTLFLDEVGELPLELQSRLLRALESRQVRRVGESRYREVDVRVVAATHRNMTKAVANKEFREDLFYRLAVVRLSVPPLRDRPEDIPVLAEHMAGQIAPGRTGALPADVLNLMGRYNWPGNVRELRNAVHRLLSLGDLSDEVTAVGAAPKSGAPGEPVDANLPYKEARERIVSSFEAAYVKAILDREHGNISRASRTAGIARRYFKELMRKHGLYGEDSGGDED